MYHRQPVIYKCSGPLTSDAKNYGKIWVRKLKLQWLLPLISNPTAQWEIRTTAACLPTDVERSLPWMCLQVEDHSNCCAIARVYYREVAWNLPLISKKGNWRSQYRKKEETGDWGGFLCCRRLKENKRSVLKTVRAQKQQLLPDKISICNEQRERI